MEGTARGHQPRYARPRQSWRTVGWRWLSADPTRFLWLAGAVILLLAAPFGGWQQAVPDERQIVAGQEVTTGPFVVTFHRAGYAAELGDRLTAMEQGGRTYVVVLATLRSTDTRPVWGTAVDALLRPTTLPEPLDYLENPHDLSDPDDTVDADVRSLLDQSGLTGVAPGLTYEVAFVYRTAAAELPDTLELTVQDYEFRASSFERMTENWYDRYQQPPVGRISLPLEALPPGTFGTAPEPAEEGR